MQTAFPHRLLTSIMRRFFYLLYNQFSWSYDFVAASVSIGRWNDWVSSVLPYLHGPRILELGHGPGHLLLSMCAKGLNVVGLDASWQMGVLAFRGLGLVGYGVVVNGYAQYLPFNDLVFDQIVSTFPSEYILDPKTLSEAYRVLADDGEFIILPSAWITGNGWLDRLAIWLFRVTGQAPAWDEAFANIIEEAGFGVKVEILERNSDRILIIKAQKT